MKIFEVLLKEEAILQDKPWTKNWLDWSDLPAELVRNNPAAFVDTEGNQLVADAAVKAAKAKLDAFRQAYPGKYPEAAWTYLGGKGPIPTPERPMQGRDLRTQPPDDSGTWIDSGASWAHTIPPFIFAIKPVIGNKATWGNFIPAEIKAAEFRKQLEAEAAKQPFQQQLYDATKGMDQVKAIEYRKQKTEEYIDNGIETMLRALSGTGTVGGKMYSNREIADGIRNEKSIFSYRRKEVEDEKAEKDASTKAKAERKAEAKAFAAAQAYRKKNGECPLGWELNDDETACVRDQDYDPSQKDDTKKDDPNKDDPKKDDPKKDNTNKLYNWPMPNNKKINKSFNPPHNGVDISAPVNTFIKAPEAGTITFISEPLKYVGGVPIFGNAGQSVVITSNDNQRVHKFFHLYAINGKLLKNGEPNIGFSVPQGFTLGGSGGAKGEPQSGHSSGPHLHWEVHVKGTPVNPLDFVINN